MAKATQKVGQPPQEEQDSTSTTTTQTSTPASPDTPTEPREDEVLAKEQSDFIDNFDLDEDNLGEDAFEEGAVVRKPAEAQPAAPAPAAPAQTPAAPAQPGTPAADGTVKPATPAPAVPAGEQPAQPAVQPGAPAAAQPTQKPAGTEAGEEPSAPAQRSPEQVQEAYKQWRGQTEGLLATHHYRLTEEEANELELNPGEVIPKLMSKVYLDAVTATLSQVVNYLPQMIESVNQNVTKRSGAENEFYGRWPQLKGHEDMVLRVGQVYRQLNPRASKEDFMNEVGAQTMVALRIPPETPQVPGKPNGNAAAAAAARAQPFVPAATAPGGGAPPQQPKNVFEQLADDFAEEELDGD